jgi:hypothetical protein
MLICKSKKIVGKQNNLSCNFQIYRTCAHYFKKTDGYAFMLKAIQWRTPLIVSWSSKEIVCKSYRSNTANFQVWKKFFAAIVTELSHYDQPGPCWSTVNCPVDSINGLHFCHKLFVTSQMTETWSFGCLTKVIWTWCSHLDILYNDK